MSGPGAGRKWLSAGALRPVALYRPLNYGGSFVCIAAGGVRSCPLCDDEQCLGYIGDGMNSMAPIQYPPPLLTASTTYRVLSSVWPSTICPPSSAFYPALPLGLLCPLPYPAACPDLPCAMSCVLPLCVISCLVFCPFQHCLAPSAVSRLDIPCPSFGRQCLRPCPLPQAPPHPLPC